MGIKYRASMRKRDYKKLEVIELDEDVTRMCVCDSVTIIPYKKCACKMFEYLDVVLHTIDKPAVKMRCCVDVIEIDANGLWLDIEHKSKYTGIFPSPEGVDERLMVHWDGCGLKISTVKTTDDTKTV